MSMSMEMQPLGDAAVRVPFGSVISEEVHEAIRRFCAVLQEKKDPAVIEWVPAYCAVTVFYDPLHWSYEEAAAAMAVWKTEAEDVPLAAPKRWLIPVCYGSGYGPDLSDTAEHCGMTEQEVIDRHTRAEYRIYMLGFIPGFPYLGGMDPAIAVERRRTPRQKVSAGAVGIAGEQTGIYPLQSPGGWQLIGQTPVRLYDRNRQSLVLMQAGDRLRFSRITPSEYESIARRVERGDYEIEWEDVT
ncbi:5-oxoprolinase subunit PxpB [Alkalicoccus chagannorensis]|uniref:5-oxoprolinase subunit PxpB n=1 Tax=Alkalicoccus chagannorensis TaxID=427072 RepID=UPI00041C1485|nr:5-oxoprolinase subunit PxpB [Alkalicoccus chagannorensis]